MTEPLPFVYDPLPAGYIRLLTPTFSEADSGEGANGEDEAKWEDGVAGWNKWDEDGSRSDCNEN